MTACIEWPGSRYAQGYGQIHIGGRGRRRRQEYVERKKARTA